MKFSKKTFHPAHTGKLIISLCMAVMCLGAVGCGNIATLKEEENSRSSTEMAGNETTEDLSNMSLASMQDAAKKDAYDAVVEMDIKDYGKIKLKLNAEAAPITVANFIKLVNEGFYDGLTINRVVPGFMIQGGDPLGNGAGGSGTNIYGEFAANNYENPISHKRGVISMANNSADPNSASSQFFIMHQDADYLDGNYAAFGEVIEGMDVVDKICDTVKAEDDYGTVAPENQPVITSAKIINE